MKKIIIGLLLVLSVGIVLAAIVEDDTEDSYTCEGNFHVTHVCENSVDENFATQACALLPSNEVKVFENYTIPSGTVDANWTVTALYQGSGVFGNGSCWNYTSSLWIELYNGLNGGVDNFTVPSGCLDGGDDNTLRLLNRYNSGSSQSACYFEGKILWDVLFVSTQQTSFYSNRKLNFNGNGGLYFYV